MRDKIEAIQKIVEWPGPTRPCPVCDDNRNLLRAVDDALSACDEVCVWRRENEYNGLVHPGCDPTHYPYSGQHGFTYCPHCGRKIKAQP
jgi:hypothetical protein